MKINMRVRKNNFSFWVCIVLTVVSTILTYFGLTGADITSWPMLFETLRNAALNPYVCLLVGVGVYNAIVDPTTPGIGDSERALSRVKPGE